VITKIAAAGPDPGGLVRYSFGRGKGNEHEHQRTVAGNCFAISDGQVTADLTTQVAADLRVNQQVWGKNPKGGHVSHIMIALDPTDKPISDAKWREIAESYMRDTGWTDPTKAGVRWTAVNHGRNNAGADHIHIIASRVRDDGTLVSTWKDAPKAREWRLAAEKRYGLVTVHSKATATQERERSDLEKVVRVAATGSRSEGEFISRLRAEGLNPSPRIDKNTRRITGYSVGRDGAKRRYGGGSLAQDLTLPALRKNVWAQPRTPRTAAHQWQHPTNNLNRVARAASMRGDQDGAVMDTADSVARIAKARSTKAPETAPRSLVDPALRPPPRRQPTAPGARIGRR